MFPSIVAIVLFKLPNLQGKFLKWAPILQRKNTGIFVDYRSTSIKLNMPSEIYNCEVVLTRLCVTKAGFFNKEEVFFNTHVEFKVDFLITRCISGTISHR